MSERSRRLFSIADDLDAVLVVNGGDGVSDYNFRYFVNPTSGIFEGSAAIVERKRTTVITSVLESGALEGLPVRVKVIRKRDDFGKFLKNSLAGVKRLGLNYQNIPVQLYRVVRKNFSGRIVDCSETLQRCRAVKDSEEIKRIREASRIASRTADSIPSMLREGMTEKELASAITKSMYDNGGEGNSFSPIVSFGKTSAIPHYSPGNVKLKRGHIVLADFGCKYMSYCSDITRTYFFGRATERQKELYQTVHEAQAAALKTLKAGVACGEVDAAARKVIDEKFSGRFIHSLGHGLGLQVHDGMPVLAGSVKEKLEENMVVTVEPGAYIPGFGGIRIEDDVVVTTSGARLLTDAKRDLVEV